MDDYQYITQLLKNLGEEANDKCFKFIFSVMEVESWRITREFYKRCTGMKKCGKVELDREENKRQSFKGSRSGRKAEKCDGKEEGTECSDLMSLLRTFLV